MRRAEPAGEDALTAANAGTDGVPGRRAPAGGGAAGEGWQGSQPVRGGRRRPLRPKQWFQVSGIPVRAHVSFAVIGALICWSFWLRFAAVASRPDALIMAVVAAVLFVGSLLAHELSHALEAKRRGLSVSDITLYVFGGATRITDDVRRPGDEFALTAIGPWTSFVLGCGFGLLAVAGRNLGLPQVAEVAGELGWLNIALAVFNLLPGAPLDGGRLLEAVVWRLRRDRVAAERVAARAGQVLGAAVAALGVGEMLLLSGGFAGGLWLVLIGSFLALAASAERQTASLRAKLQGRQVADLLYPVPRVPAGLAVGHAVEAIARQGWPDIVAIVGHEGIVGVVPLEDLRAVPEELLWRVPLHELMTPVAELPSVQRFDPATVLLPYIGAGPIAVRDGPHLETVATTTQLLASSRWLHALPAAASRQAGEPGGAGEALPPARRGARLRAALFVAVSVAVVAAAATVVPMPLVELSPGPALDVPAMLRTSGPSHPVRGRLLLTSVRLDAPTAVGTARALLDPHRELLFGSSLVPSGMDPADYDASQRQVFLDSVQLAAGVALRAAGYPVTISGGGAVVRAVASGGPADGRLFPGDVVLAVGGVPVSGSADLLAAVSTSPAGVPLRLQVRRGATVLQVQVPPAWSGELEQPVLGIAVEDAAPSVRLPFPVQATRTDLGGPSAGLMLALSVYSLTTGTDLTGGESVAGTGTIDSRGAVGPVGGVAEKVVAAARAGASLFLVPSSEAGSARRAAAGLRLDVVAVDSFSQALARLRGGLGN